jgi:hypothetical protein
MKTLEEFLQSAGTKKAVVNISHLFKKFIGLDWLKIHSEIVTSAILLSDMVL